MTVASTANAAVNRVNEATAIPGDMSVIASAVVRWWMTVHGWRPVSRNTHPPTLAV